MCKFSHTFNVKFRVLHHFQFQSFINKKDKIIIMGPLPSKQQEGNSLSSQGSSQQIDETSAVLVSHERFHKVQFFMKTKQMKVELLADNKTVLVEWANMNKSINIQQINQYALIPKSWQYQKTAMCGNMGVVKIVYDYFPFLLQKQIQTRSSITKFLTENQLFDLLYALVVCTDKFHSNWRKVGDIRPKNIFKNEKGQIKIANRYSWPMQLTNYQKTVFQKQITYLAPQEIHDIKMGRIDPDNSRNAKQHIIEAQSFSIGLTLLHAGLLTDMSSLYNTTTNQFDRNQFTKRVYDWQKLTNYTNTIKEIVKGLCQQIPEKRLLTSDLQPLLKPVKQLNKAQLKQQVINILQKKSAQSLVGTIWKACQGGLLQSFVLQKSRALKEQSQRSAIQQIKPSKTQQIKQSPLKTQKNISLGGSNLSKVSSQKSSQKNNYKISNYEIGNRFGNPTITDEKFSPQKSKYEYGNNYKVQDSSYFTTPLGQSLYTFPNAGQSQFQASRLQSRFKPSQSNFDLLRQIEDQLQKSRKNFPN